MYQLNTVISTYESPPPPPSCQLAVLSQRQEHKEKELLVRLDGSEEAHRKSTHELRDLLAAQHRVGTRLEGRGGGASKLSLVCGGD